MSAALELIQNCLITRPRPEQLPHDTLGYREVSEAKILVFG
ncbi:hypothetical protein GFS60_06537 (plasmid) [Rhodococcus sp. WAY2]|nr:hypothetical protein GFS60_06537 [Rhodococcus sp. WAY2]